MNSLILTFISVSAGIVLVMSLFSIFIHLHIKSSMTKHMMEVWLSYLLYFLISLLTEGYAPEIVALAMVGWMWRVRAYRLILEDISLTNLQRRWHKPLLVLSFILGIAGYLQNFPFGIYTIPVCLGITLVGCSQVIESFLALKKRSVDMLYYAFLGNVLFVFLHILNYPYLRTNPDYAMVGFALALFTTFLTAVLLPSLLLSEQAKNYAISLEGLVEERSQQLINQSKFSALGEMAAGVAHEINNPLAVISGKASQLKRFIKTNNIDPEKFSAGLESIENTAFRISRIIKGLKDFSRNAENIPMQNMPLELIINETLDLCRERFSHQGVELRVSSIPDVVFYCRNVQISQVLLNVLNNAYDAVQESQEKWVQLDFEDRDLKLIIRIQDSGPGVKAEIRNKIMMPFFTTKEVGKGTGLGLSISKGIVEDHQGSFYLDSEHPRTCFVLELPKASKTTQLA